MKKTLISMLLAAAVLVPGLAFAQEGAWQDIHQDNQAIRQNTQNFYQDKAAAQASDMQEQNDIAHGNLMGAIVDNQAAHEAKHDARVDAANIGAAENAKHEDIHALHQSEYDQMRERQARVDHERHERMEREAEWNRDHDHGWDHDHDRDHDHGDWHHDHDHDGDDWRH